MCAIFRAERPGGQARSRMVGRRKGQGEFCREDQWFSKETLYKVIEILSLTLLEDLTFVIQDHIAEVIKKWSNIEDEIWAKVGTQKGTFRNTFVPGDNFGKKQTSCKSVRTSSNPHGERI